jgi:hypothetical protein
MNCCERNKKFQNVFVHIFSFKWLELEGFFYYDIKSSFRIIECFLPYHSCIHMVSVYFASNPSLDGIFPCKVCSWYDVIFFSLYEKQLIPRWNIIARGTTKNEKLFRIKRCWDQGKVFLERNSLVKVVRFRTHLLIQDPAKRINHMIGRPYRKQEK